jgi:membrane associated rhomboid family serine protease
MRRGGPSPIAFGTSWTLRFVVLLIAAFVMTKGAAGWFGWRGEGSLVLSRAALENGRWWTLVTAAFVQGDAWSLAFGCLGLWFFGKLVEETLGGARYVAFFVLAIVVPHAVAAAAAFGSRSIGGSAGPTGIVMAFLVFAAFRYPGLPVRFFLLPLVLWQIAVLYVGVELLGAATLTGSRATFTTLGGAALGWFVHRFGLPEFRLPSRAPKKREPGPFATANADHEVDRILDKINATAIGSLTDAEREFLKRDAGRR